LTICPVPGAKDPGTFLRKKPMNYIYIDTKTGKFGVPKSRKRIEEFSEGELKANSLVNHFWGNSKVKKENQTFTNDRFIVLPIPEHDKLFEDPDLIGNINSIKKPKK